MWDYIIPAVAAIIVAIIEAIAAKERRAIKKKSDLLEQRAARRAEESRLSMQMMYATLQLSIVTANALTGGHNNGNVAKAKEAAEKAESDYQEFLQKVASEAMNK